MGIRSVIRRESVTRLRRRTGREGGSSSPLLERAKGQATCFVGAVRLAEGAERWSGQQRHFGGKRRQRGAGPRGARPGGGRCLRGGGGGGASGRGAARRVLLLLVFIFPQRFHGFVCGLHAYTILQSDYNEDTTKG